MKRSKPFILFSIFLLLMLQDWSGLKPASEGEREKLLGQLLFQSLKQWHYSPKELDKKYSSLAFDQFIKALDFGKAFLITEDLQDMEKYRLTMVESLRSGRYELVVLADKILNRRLQQVQEIVQSILKKNFDFSLQESIEIDTEKRDYCQNEEELRDYWRKRLKYLTLIRYYDIIDGKSEGETDITQKKPFSWQPEIENEAREAVKKSITSNLQRLFLNQNRQEILNRFFNALTAASDPHSSYLPPKRREDFEIEMSGSLEGIGALLGEENGFIKVVEIVPGGPAWKQKELEVEDVILKAGQDENEAVDLVDMAITDAVRIIRGKKDTIVRLTVRKPDGRIIVIPIKRDVVVLQETFARGAVLINDKRNIRIGYIYLPRFYHDFNQVNGRNATSDVKKLVTSLAAANVDGIVLDLRGNRGGTLDDAVRITGLFLPGGPVVQVKGRGRSARAIMDEDKEVAWDGPLAVMINPLSASASEIVAAALQDFGRALVISGPHSFGKGTVQAILNLDHYLQGDKNNFNEPLGALTLTIQQFYRISGEAIQKKGVIPDIILPDPYEHLEIGERFLDNSLAWEKLPALYFKPLDNYSDFLPGLREKSANRLQKEAYFITLIENIKRLKKIRSHTLYSLNLEDFISEQRKLRAEAARFKLEPFKKPELRVESQERSGTESEEDPYQEWKKKWLDEIGKDPFIDEALQVLADFVDKGISIENH